MKTLVAIAALLLLPSAAFAQGNPGPFGGLFGRTPERTGSEFTVFELRNSVAGQFESALLVDDAVPDEDVPAKGYTAGVNTGLAFERRTDRTQFAATGGATYQEFYRTPVFGATTYDAGLRASGTVTNRLTLDAQARYLRSPFFRLVPGFTAAGPAVTVPGDPSFVRLLLNESYDVSGGFVSRYAKHSSIRASVSQRHTVFQERDSYDIVRAEGRWQRQVNRSFALRLGYAREEITQSTIEVADYLHEYLDIGVDFSRQLSVARRTSVAFNTQTSMIKRPETGRSYRLNGAVSLATLFGRTGSATLSVSRNTEFMPGFIEPLYSAGVNGSISGMPSLKTEWQTTVSAGRGRFGLEAPDDFLTASLMSRFNYALTSKFGVYAQYAAYYYEQPPATSSSMVFLLGQVSRQAVTVGINTWFPLINKVRVPRDPE